LKIKPKILTAPVVRVFDQIMVQAQLDGVDYESVNRKERASLVLGTGQVWVEVCLFPLEPFSGPKPINRAESVVCDPLCAHTAINAPLTGAGRCYVNHLGIKRSQQKALQQLESKRFNSLLVGGYILRLTKWGDISALNNDGLAWALELCVSAAETRAYSNIWRHEESALEAGDLWRYRLIQGLKGFVQASVSSVEDALKAKRAGWKVYAGARQDEIRAALIAEGVRVYKCPYTTPTGRVFCANCPMPCDGTRHIMSPKEPT